MWHSVVVRTEIEFDRVLQPASRNFQVGNRNLSFRSVGMSPGNWKDENFKLKVESRSWNWSWIRLVWNNEFAIWIYELMFSSWKLRMWIFKLKVESWNFELESRIRIEFRLVCDEWICNLNLMFSSWKFWFLIFKLKVGILSCNREFELKLNWFVTKWIWNSWWGEFFKLKIPNFHFQVENFTGFWKSVTMDNQHLLFQTGWQFI